MANWKHWFCVSAAVALLTASCLAQSTYTTLRQNGNLLGASYAATGPYYYVYVHISAGDPIDGPFAAKGGDTYLVYWRVITFAPPPPPPGHEPTDIVFTQAEAVVPASKIKLSPTGALSIDLDVSSPETIFARTQDCTAWPCTYSIPATFPLNASFAWYTGIGSYATTSTGTQQSRNVDPICPIEQSFNGQRTSGSANFSGVIGPLTVVPPPAGYNASMNLSKGMLRIENRCTPPPM